MKQPRITIWRGHPSRGSRWHWHWKAANGLLVAREAQANGYVDKRDAVKGLEAVTGGTVEIIYGAGTAYQQGKLTRWAIGGSTGLVRRERIFIEVHG